MTSALGLLGTGCAFEGLDEGVEGAELVGVHEGAVESENRLSMNRLSMNRLSMNSLSQQSLSTSSAGVTLFNNLITDESGRELLTYILQCALKSDQSVTATYNSVTYTFHGKIGLASDWISNPLNDVKKRRWVSACLLAHVNGYGIQVPISLRGDHPALAASPTEKAEYSVQETAFFGNVFEGGYDPEDSPQFYSCGGKTISTQCGSTPESFRPQRSCADTTSCVLAFEGICKSSSGLSGNACRTADAAGYRDCSPSLTGANGLFPAGAEQYKEVVTVYLRPAEFNQLYLGCASLQ